MLALIDRLKHSVGITTHSAPDRVPSQALREYDVTDEGCEFMRRRFNDSFFADEEWDDVDDGGRRVASR